MQGSKKFWQMVSIDEQHMQSYLYHVWILYQLPTQNKTLHVHNDPKYVQDVGGTSATCAEYYNYTD